MRKKKSKQAPLSVDPLFGQSRPAVPFQEDEKILDQNVRVIDSKKLCNSLSELLGVDKKTSESSSIIRKATIDP